MKNLKKNKQSFPILDDSLIRALMDDYNNFYEVLNGYNIRIYFSNIDDGLHAVVYYSSKGSYRILINDSLSFEYKQKAFLHEVKHIIDDMPKYTYAVCFDTNTNTVNRIEFAADNFANNFIDIYDKK